MSRFIIEGEWSGYTSSQQRIVHRTVYPGSHKALRAWAVAAHAIRFTDGTQLRLTVRDMKPREKVQKIDGYTSLIAECAHHNVTSVMELPPR